MPAGSRGFEMKRPTTLVAVVLAAVLAGGAVRVVQDQCGPFTDVTPGFCPFVLELYYLGITAGTSATTFSPDDPLTRGQGAVFIAKGLNQSLARSSRRAALGQWWTTQTADTLQIIPIGVPDFVQSDGTDVWISSNRNNSVTRVRSSDGRIVETWTGIGNAFALLPAMGRIFVSGYSTPGSVYAIDPATPPGTQQTIVADVGPLPSGLAFDGSRLWVARQDGLAILTPGSTTPWSFVTVTAGFTVPGALLFDGTNMWVTDVSGSLLRLDSSGSILQTIALGATPTGAAFDGANIWVGLAESSSVAVIQASTGNLLQVLTGNGLDRPSGVAFDGERLMVTSYPLGVSLWRASDFTPLGSATLFPHGSPLAVCSDGVSFWISMSLTEELARF
jgi:hypothetical protein